jgi:hypothetical protein
VVEAIDDPGLRRGRGWDLWGWRHDPVPWGVRFGFRGAHRSVALPAGGSVLVAPEHPHPLQGPLLAFRVLGCQERAEGGHLLTGAFDPPLSDEEARTLVED